MKTVISTLNKLMQLPLTQRRLRISPEELERHQLQRLRKTLELAYERVPLYRERFDKAGVHPDLLESAEDLARFPITEKDDVRDAFPTGCVVRGTRLEDCRIQQTSGSSGQCMEIAIDRWSDDQRTLFTQRVYGLVGFSFWKRMAYLFPYPLPLQKNVGLYRNRHISTNDAPERILAQLRSFRPHLLAATPSDLFDLMEELDEDLTELALERICVHSEPMSRDERAHIEARFGCPVSTNYYCNEVWAIGTECRAGQLHQFPDNVVVEIVDNRGHALPRGEIGNVLVTSLNNFVQPFIRYRVGDLAAWSTETDTCECGLTLPRLRVLEGRDDDYIELCNGRRVHPSKLTVAVKKPCFAHPGAQIYRDYRITQDEFRHVTIQIVPGRDREWLEACTRDSKLNVQQVLGPGFGVDLRIVAALQRGSGGKRKIVERLHRER